MLRTRYLAAAIAAAMVLVTSTAQASEPSPFDNVVVFGDSLSDNGNFSSKLFPNGPTARFTTNPGEVAVELVAQHYGFTLAPSTSGGTDYAWGGALAGTDTSEFGIPIPSTQHQLDGYFAATGGRADPHALYTFWIGANDLFGAIDANNANGTATATTAAQAALNGIGRLQNAGARYIVVFNIPDLSKTPSYNTSPQAASAGALTAVFNNQLNAGLAQLGIGIIPINAYALLNQVIADPTRYGFTDVTHEACNSFSSILCTPASLVTPDAASQYLFADGVHPTTAAHAMLAQVVLSELAAPRQISLLGEAPLAATTVQSGVLRDEMLKDQDGATRRTFVNLDYSQQRFDGSVNAPQTQSNNLNFTAGVDTPFNPNLSGGLALGVARNNAGTSGGGGYQLKDYSALGYLTWHLGGGYLGGYASYGHSNFNDINRSFDVGAARITEGGETDGNHRGVGLTGGWLFDVSTLKTGPFATVEWQDINVGGYHEYGDDATAMWFGDQRREALVSTLGWRLQGKWQVSNLAMAPYLELAWNHDSKADAREVSTGLNTMNGSFALTGFVPDKTWGTASIGLTAQLTPNVSSWIGYSGRFHDDNQKLNNYNMGFKIAF
jgi:outer membrane lipase/esterase